MAKSTHPDGFNRLRSRGSILLILAIVIVTVVGCSKPQTQKRRDVERMIPVEPYETTARLRHEFAEVPSRQSELQENARATFIANLKTRFKPDITTMRDKAKRPGDRFMELMRELNPVMIPWREFESIAGEPTRVEKVPIPNTDINRTVRHYEFTVDQIVSRWTFYRKGSSIEYHRLELQTGRLIPPQPAKPSLPKPEAHDRLSPGEIWKDYVEADSDAEFARARIALRDLLKRLYPDVQGMGKRGFYRGDDEGKVWLEHWMNAAGLFRECNFIGWPKGDIKFLFGEPRKETEDRLVFSFMAGTDDFSIEFEFSNGIVVMAGH